MADYQVDDLQIKVEAESEEAAQKVDNLVNALKRLLQVTKSDFGNITDKIRAIGESATHSLPAQTTQRKRALNRSIKDTGISDKGIDFEIDADKAVNDFTKDIEDEFGKIKPIAVFTDIKPKEELFDKGTTKELDVNAKPAVDTSKLDLSLAKATPEIEKIQNKYAALQKRLEDIKNLNPMEGIADTELLQSAIQKFSEFSAATDKAQGAFENIKNAINDVNSGTKELSATEISALSKEFQNLGSIAKYSGKSVEEALRMAEQSAKQSKSAFSDVSNIINASDKDIQKLESTYEKLSGQLDKLKSADGIDAKKIVDASAQIKQLSSQIDVAKTNGDLLKDTIQKISSGEIQATTEQIKKLSDEYINARDSARQLGAEMQSTMQGIKKDTEEAKESVSGLGQVISGLEKIFPNFGKKFSDLKRIKEGIGQISSGFGSIGVAKVKPTVELPDVSGSTGAATKAIGGLSTGSLVAVAAIAGLAKALLSVGKAGLKFAGIVGGVTVNSIKALAKATTSLVKGSISRVGKTIDRNFIAPFRRAIKSIKTWKSAIGRIAFYRAVRTAIKMVTDGFRDGIDNLYQYSRLIGTEFAPAMNSLATSALYLKNSLGAVAAPLIQAIAPVVDMLVDKFVALLNVIGKVFAALTGKNVYSQAKKHAVEYADAANGASKATEKFLLGIDELNIIDDPQGAGYNAMEDYGSMFEEVEVPTDTLDFAKQIRDAIERGDWRGAGAILAEKMNGIIESFDSRAWGNKLGEKLNNGLNAVYGFLTTFDFVTLGKKFADGIVGILEKIDFYLLGQTIAAEINAMWDFIYGAVTTIPWEDVGTWIAQAINGWVDERKFDVVIETMNKLIIGVFTGITSAIQGIEWANIGTQLAEALGKIDWYGIITSVGTAISTAIGSLATFIQSFVDNFPWEETAEQIYNGLNNAFSNINVEDLFRSLGDAVSHIATFLAKIINETDWNVVVDNIVKGLKAVNWNDVLDALSDLFAAVFNGLTSILQSDELKKIDWRKIGETIGEKISDTISKINWKELGNTLSNFGINLLNALSGIIRKLDVGKVFKAIKDFFDGVDWIGLGSALGDLVGSIFTGIIDMLADPETNIAVTTLKLGAEIVAGLLGGIVSALVNIGSWLKENLVDPIVDGVKKLLGIKSPSTVFEGIGNNVVAGLLAGIKKTWDSITEFFESGWNKIKNIFGVGSSESSRIVKSSYDETKKDAISQMNDLASTSDEGWGKINSTAQEKLDSLRTYNSSTYDTVYKDTRDRLIEMEKASKEKFGNISTNADTNLQKVKSSATVNWAAVNTLTLNNTNSAKDSAVSNFSAMQNEVTDKLTKIKSANQTEWDAIKVMTIKSAEAVNTSVKLEFGKIKDSIVSSLNSAVNAVKGLDWSSVGKNITSGIVKGLDSGKKDIVSKMQDVGESAHQKIQSYNDSHSPSRLYRDTVGLMMGLGIAEGISKSENSVVSSIKSLAEDAKNEFSVISSAFNEAAELQFPEHDNNFYARRPDYPEDDRKVNDTDDGTDKMANAVKLANEDIINVMYATAQQIVSAVRESGGDVYLDGMKVGKRTTNIQNRQNIMYGKIM